MHTSATIGIHMSMLPVVGLRNRRKEVERALEEEEGEG
jgi:hypothetical protein